MKKMYTLISAVLLLATGFAQTLEKQKLSTKPKAVKETKPTTKKSTATDSKAATGSKEVKETKPVPKKLVANITSTSTDGGHDIEITLTPAKNQRIYLGSYYGNGFAIVDSCLLDDKCKGHFKGDKKITGGIYLIVSPQKAMWFDLLIGDVQKFSFTADTVNKNTTTIVGSPDNDIYKQYTKTSIEIGTAINSLKAELGNAKTKEDTLALYKKLKAKDTELQKFRDGIIEKYPDALISSLFTAMRQPETPEIPCDPVTKKCDSAYPFRYVKEHFWDDVNFADARLLRTPFFEKKIDEYFKYYLSPEADSIIPMVKYMLLYARSSDEMYGYLLIKFTNKYMNPEYMGQDKVFVYLGSEHFLRGDTTFLDAKSRKTVIDEYYKKLLGQIGNTAPALDLTDTTGKVVSLYSIKAKYIVVAYWDPTCGHCRTEIPQLDSFYRAKWQKEDVKIYSITSKDDLVPELKKFIKEKNLPTTWYYTYETREARDATEKAGIPNFRQAYDFNRTPIFYLLDADKKIVAKMLTLHQLDNIMNAFKNKKK